MPKYPECEKLAAVHEKSQAIGAFLEWLETKDISLMTRDHNDDCCSPRMSIEEMLAEFFEIDLNKVEEERRAILEDIEAARVSLIDEMMRGT